MPRKIYIRKHSLPSSLIIREILFRNFEHRYIAIGCFPNLYILFFFYFQMTSILLIGTAWLLAVVFALPVPVNTDLKIHELEPRIERVLGYQLFYSYLQISNNLFLKTSSEGLLHGELGPPVWQAHLQHLHPPSTTHPSLPHPHPRPRQHLQEARLLQISSEKVF